MMSICLFIYHLLRVCHTLVPEIYVHPEMFCVFRYIEVLTYVINNCTQQEWLELLMSSVKIIDEDWLVGECADTWYS